MLRQKKWFYRLCKGGIKKWSALNNLRKKGTSLILREDELLAERVGNYPYLYDKFFKEHQEKDVVENASKNMLKNQVLKVMLSIQ